MATEYLTIQDVAKELRTSTKTVWRWCATGRLRVLQTSAAGGLVRISRRALDDFIEQNSRGGDGDQAEA